MRSIILDVDDVLNSLTLPILELYGCDIGHFDYHKYPVEVGYDIRAACKVLGGNAPEGLGPFWEGVTEGNIWRTAPKSLECDWILDKASDTVGLENVFLATTPTKDPQVHADKLHWIWDNLPSWIHRQYFITPRKWKLGKPGTILFDDHSENCEKFIAEGGEACLVPRPWNKNHSLPINEHTSFYFDGFSIMVDTQSL